MPIVLDACALIAFLRHESGADIVESLISEDVASMVHAVNLCEVFYDFIRAADEPTARAAVRDIESVGVVVREDMDTEFWQDAGRYKASFKVSLADCFTIALASREKATVVTSDHREFDPIAQSNICKIRFIR